MFQLAILSWGIFPEASDLSNGFWTSIVMLLTFFGYWIIIKQI